MLCEKPMSPRLTMICGLPGSGKSHWIEQHEKEFARVIPDFFKNALFNCSDGGRKFWRGRSYPELIVDLRSGRQCCIADVILCRAEARDSAEKVLREAVPGIEITWLAFENKPELCERNVKYDHERKGRNLEHRLQTIRELAPAYSIPDNAAALPIGTPE